MNAVRGLARGLGRTAAHGLGRMAAHGLGRAGAHGLRRAAAGLRAAAAMLAPWGALPGHLVAAGALALALAAPGARAQAPVEQPRAFLSVGVVDGVLDGAVAVYRGIPYAAPPVAALRWKPPGPAPQWNRTLAATTAGPACPQPREAGHDGDLGPMSEDCLYLNVFAPAGRPATPRPVMVWLHGGSLAAGSANLPLYDGRALARRGVVVVTLNHRLGPLGYFAHPALEREQPRGPVNFGLMDQVAALAWVKQNIAGFGGDPARVTLFGQSAGAQSVLALMASPLARGLFQGAIAQSPYGIASHRRKKAVEVGSDLARAVGLRGAKATLAELRQVPAAQWVEAGGPGLTLAPSLVFGDAAMPRPLLAAFQQGVQAPVPLIVGSTNDESMLIEAFGLRAASLDAQLARARVVVPDPPATDRADTTARREHALLRDGVFTAYARQLARLHSARAPTWRYHFNHVGPSPAPAAPDPRTLVALAMRQPPGAGTGTPARPAGLTPQTLPNGAPVGAPLVAAVDANQGAAQRTALRRGGRSELPYVWGTTTGCGCLPAAPTAGDRDLERRLGDRWVHFATHGRPTPDGAWPQDEASRPVVMTLGTTEAPQWDFMRERLDALADGLKLDGKPAGTVRESRRAQAERIAAAAAPGPAPHRAAHALR